MPLLASPSFTPAPTTDDAPAPHRPSLPAVIRRVAVSLLIACVIPAALFYASLVVAGVWAAMGAALVWSYGAIVWRAMSRRRASGLLILTAVVMTARTLVALAADSPFLYFLQPIISDGVVAAVFLLSLTTARPLVARLAGDFYPMDDELSVRPRIQQLFWQLTLLWGVVCLGKGSLTLWLLMSQSLETFVLVKSVAVLGLTGLAVAATIAAAAVVARSEGLLEPAPAS